MVYYMLQDYHGQCQIGQSPVISYAIKYFDPHTNASCGLDIIAASSCIDQICKNVFDLDTLCSNSTSVLVTVSAMNALGDEQESEPITVVLRELSCVIVCDCYIFLVYYSIYRS